MRRVCLLLMLLASHGAAVLALAPGTYKIRFPLRTNCGNKQGLLSAFPCTDPVNRVTLRQALTGRQNWSLEPLAGAADIKPNATVVRIKVSGRTGCWSYLSYPKTCAGAAFFQARAETDLREQWLLEGWGVMYRLRPLLCPRKYLGFPTNCSAAIGQLLPVGPNNVVAATFVPQKPSDGNGTAPPAVQSPAPLPPSPSPSPPLPPLPSPSPSPPPVESPPSPAPSPPPASNDSTNSTSAGTTVTVAKAGGWGDRYEGVFVIENRNNYTILNWELAFTIVGAGNFTWGPSDVDVTWLSGGAAVLKPKEWLKDIAAGATLRIGYGGVGASPSGFRFKQILPLLDPDNDLSMRTRGRFPAKVFSPFVDAVLYPTPSLVDMHAATGQKWYTLAFITANIIKKVPAWGGVIGMEKQYFMDQIREIRLLGGDTIVSFGGASGQELAQVIADENALVATYQSVIDLYKLRWIDFDIEGGAVAHPPSIDLRNRAIRRLQAANPSLTVSYTLPVLPAGLTADGVALLRNAVMRGVRVDVLNIMTMDYGDSAAPDPVGRMGQYAIDAAKNTYRQALSVNMNTKIGVCPMIGKNDVETEIFNQTDAHKVGRWAQATPWVRWTAFWSMGRDKFNPQERYVSIHSSSIEQAPFEFAKIFQRYAA